VRYGEVLGDKCTMYIRVTLLRVLDCIVTISFGFVLYFACCNLFCNVWVSVYGGVSTNVWGVLVICVLVFTVFLYFFFYVYL
jgi:hypothetical protein